MKIQATIATLVVALIATLGALAYIVGGGMFSGEATAMTATGIDVATPDSGAAGDAATGQATGRRQHNPVVAGDEDQPATDAPDAAAADSAADEAAATDQAATDPTAEDPAATDAAGEAGEAAEAGETNTPGAPTTDGEAAPETPATPAEPTEPAAPAEPTEPAAPATPSCAPAHHYDPVSGECVPTIAPPLCAPGYVHNADATDCVSICAVDQYYDIAAGICRDVEIAPPLCIDGYVLNETMDGCVEPTCPADHYFNVATHTCEEITVAPPFCAPGFVLNEAGDACVEKLCPLTHFLNAEFECEPLIFTFCPDGQELVGTECLPACAPHEVRIGTVCTEFQVADPSTIICGPGESLIGGTCIGLDLDPDVIVQVNPDLLPDVPGLTVEPNGPVLPDTATIPGGLVLDLDAVMIPGLSG